MDDFKAAFELFIFQNIWRVSLAGSMGLSVSEVWNRLFRAIDDRLLDQGRMDERRALRKIIRQLRPPERDRTGARAVFP